MKYYTLIGSRKTPQKVLTLMTKLVTKLSSQGWCGRSGGAKGADTCLEEGVDKGNPSQRPYCQEVYLPWGGFGGRMYGRDDGYYILRDMDNSSEAKQLAESLHPAWERCSQGAQLLHTRNVYQVLGQDLNTPSTFLVCYAEPVNKSFRDDIVKGGTGTAVRLAKERGVEIINLYYEEDLRRIEEYIKEEKHHDNVVAV